MRENSKIMPLGVLMVLSLGLGACSSAPGMVLATAGLVSFVHTDKTLTDHAISMATEKNCSLLHSANNEPYCQDLESEKTAAELEAEALMAQTHCYRTLGAISCYRQPDTMASAQARVN